MGFFKRESKPTDNEVLISRLVDRSCGSKKSCSSYHGCLCTWMCVPVSKWFIPSYINGMYIYIYIGLYGLYMDYEPLAKLDAHPSMSIPRSVCTEKNCCNIPMILGLAISMGTWRL